MNSSPSIAQLAAALAGAQAEMESARKDSSNPHYQSTYANLSAIWDACRGPLSRHELAVVQMPESLEVGHGVTITTVLMHSSGEWISSQLRIIPTKDDAQGLGSAITYGRRYTLAAAVGIAPADTDDDGNAASGKPSKPEAVTETTRVISRPKQERAAPPVKPAEVKPQADAVIAALTPTPLPPVNVHAHDDPEYIDTKTQQDFAGLFRESLPAAYRKEAEELRHDWLGLRGYVDDHGNPSSKMIPRKDYVVAKRMAIMWATEYGSGK